MVYGIICGVRYDVGVDYIAYFESYMSYVKYGVSEAAISQEPGWIWYTKLLATRGVHYSVYFATIALSQIALIVFTFKKNPKLLPYVILVFFLSEWFILSQNVLRQIIVTFIFLFVAVRYPKLPLYKSFVLSVLAAFIHTTGILIFIFLLFVRYDWKKINVPPLILIGIYVCLALIGLKTNVLDSLASNPLFTIILAGSDYQYYMTSNNLAQGTGTAVGLGFMLNVIVRCIVFSQSKAIANSFPMYRFKSWFYCYYIGLCITVLFPTSILFTRLFWFFMVLIIPVYAVFFKYCFDKVSNFTLALRSLRFQLGSLVIVCLIMLSATSLFLKPQGGNMTYTFYWDQKIT